ncbi:hypothetical protein KL86DYS2_12437 [uncultured Dysgonomonas sp.]|uniref:Uncharacterized protein n=1 Tax=uncultured Dysgonomonas sp. TaxID=206096 RepID=A0A212JVF4_9BACT|nr:hypothetical protein KL86DYS2_12437 [uncultured Dysgonomonas sp.]
MIGADFFVLLCSNLKNIKETNYNAINSEIDSSDACTNGYG